MRKGCNRFVTFLLRCTYAAMYTQHSLQINYYYNYSNFDPASKFHGDRNPPVNPEVAKTSSQPDQDQLEAMETTTAATGQGNAGLVADATAKWPAQCPVYTRNRLSRFPLYLNSVSEPHFLQLARRPQAKDSLIGMFKSILGESHNIHPATKKMKKPATKKAPASSIVTIASEMVPAVPSSRDESATRHDASYVGAGATRAVVEEEQLLENGWTPVTSRTKRKGRGSGETQRRQLPSPPLNLGDASSSTRSA